MAIVFNFNNLFIVYILDQVDLKDLPRDGCGCNV